MVRSLRKEDLSRVIEIGNTAWREIQKMSRQCYGDELFEILTPDEKNFKGRQIKEYITEHLEWAFVFEEDGNIIGFITFSLDYGKKIGEIYNNAVDPMCGLKGIGQQMYQAVLKRFRDEGMLYAEVKTGLDYAHAPARKAYERAGFNIRHENVQYFMRL